MALGSQDLLVAVQEGHRPQWGGLRNALLALLQLEPQLEQPVGALLEQHIVVTFIGTVGVVVVAQDSKSSSCFTKLSKQIFSKGSFRCRPLNAQKNVDR